MQFTTPFIIICSILCATNSFDMKYSLLKHSWKKIVSDDILKDTIDNDPKYALRFKRIDTYLLQSTNLAGGVLLTDSYILAVNIELHDIKPSCIFSMERKGNKKLALCLEPAGENAATITLDSANIPDGKLSFGYKIIKDQNTKLILSVNKTSATLLKDCEVIEEKQFKSNISKEIHLTDDMDLKLGYALTSDKYWITIWDLDLYSPTDITTLPFLCPNLGLSQFRGDNGEKGDKGETGERGAAGPKGDTGRKGEKGESKTGPMGLMGPKGDKGGFGLPGTKGEAGSCECTKDVLSSLLKSMPEMRGPPGDKGTPGLNGMPGINGNNASPACTADYDAMQSIATAMKSIASGMKLFSDYIIDKTEEMKQRMDNSEQNIKALRDAILDESQL